jgi:3-deoxy-D-manno-octulosonate 8-phosphate phosphatase (KDO 8-P phosphatase)
MITSKSNAFSEQFSDITTIFFDVDGVFTDGSIVYSDRGDEYKTFNALDGLGIILLQYSNIKPVIVTARKSKIVTSRFNELHVSEIYTGVLNKKKFISEYILNKNLQYSELAIMGDDLPDLLAFDLVKNTFAPKNSVDLVKSSATHVTKNYGGSGAVREVCDLIMMSKGIDQLATLNLFISEKGKKNGSLKI